jgi:hypothetical protein
LQNLGLRPLLALHAHTYHTLLTSSGQRNCALWAPQPQKLVTFRPQPEGGTTKSIWACGGIGGKKFGNNLTHNLFMCQSLESQHDMNILIVQRDVQTFPLSKFNAVPVCLPFLPHKRREPGSSVGIATGYGLNGPGIESRWGCDFSHTFRPVLGPTQPLVQWVLGLSRG